MSFRPETFQYLGASRNYDPFRIPNFLPISSCSAFAKDLLHKWISSSWNDNFFLNAYLWHFLSAGLFYDGLGNEIGAEMALMEASKLNTAAAIAEYKAAKEVSLFNCNFRQNKTM